MLESWAAGDQRYFPSEWGYYKCHFSPEQVEMPQTINNLSTASKYYLLIVYMYVE